MQPEVERFCFHETKIRKQKQTAARYAFSGAASTSATTQQPVNQYENNDGSKTAAT